MSDPIITHYSWLPCQIREYSWSALRDNYEPGWPIGFGRTEQEATADLLAEEEAYA
jgi:hypothetical protein